MSQTLKEFLAHLRQEKLDTQNRRADFIKLKFLLVVGLFGIGNWKFSEAADNYILLYVVPFVGYALDLYIHGENYAIRRIGFFVREISNKIPIERAWELFVDKNRDKFTRSGIYVVSTMLFICVFLILEFKKNNIIRSEQIFWHYLWATANVIILLLFIILSHRGYQSIYKNEIPIDIEENIKNQ